MTIKELLSALAPYDLETETNIEDVAHFKCECCGCWEVDLITRRDLEEASQRYMEDHPEEFQGDE